MGKKFTVTDHAVIRYMERVMGLNMQDIRNKMLTKDIRDKVISQNGNCRIPVDKHYAIFKNYNCVTITREAQRDYLNYYDKKKLINKKGKFRL